MISKHISDKEGDYSRTALRRGIDNTPEPYHLVNMQVIAELVFEPLREWVKGPIKINSFYRCKELNFLHSHIGNLVFGWLLLILKN
mgnify:CR=1 FL=1